METTPKVEILNPIEKAMYVKFSAENHGMTEQDFKELRDLAVKAKNAGSKTFFRINNLILTNQPDQDALKEIKGN